MDKFLHLKNNDIINKIHSLPRLPGVYQFLNKKNKIIYIGKAKNLKLRVKSYFQNIKNQTPKTALMINKIVDFEWILVRNEVEALITEANLIKRYRPRYNIDLKDDKNFPYIKISNEPFPQVLLVRKIIKDGSKYFGPFTDVKMLRNIMKALKKVFPIRSCSFYLDDKVIEKKKVLLCLDYHIKKCEGPCEGIVSQEHYSKMIERVEDFMKGNIRITISYIKKMMKIASAQQRYEDAAIFRDQLNAIDLFKKRQSFVANDLKERDVIALAYEKNIGIAVVIRIRNGRIFSREKIYLKNLSLNFNEIMKYVLIRFYMNSESIPKEISLQYKPTEEENIKKIIKRKNYNKIQFIYPKIGEKAKELKITYQNAKLLLGEWVLKNKKYRNYIPKTLLSIQKDLGLKIIPRKIEAFDVSHHNAENTVASMVSFLNAKANKKEYRKFNIKSVKGIDDFSSIKEVVYRRYSRLKKNKELLPDLILIDGGKGQLNYAKKALKELSINSIPIIGLAKRLEQVFIPGNSEPQIISKHSPGLILLRKIRDEAHRFAITFHRNKQLKLKNKSKFLDIKGIGVERFKILMKNFGDYENLIRVTPEQIKLKTSIPLYLCEEIISLSKKLKDKN